ncbi:MAG: murein hydrolase activator EnvC family protein [Patescibacteria group bacterium]|jgi:peptidoglycan hydrolase CwlO-like protein
MTIKRSLIFLSILFSLVFSLSFPLSLKSQEDTGSDSTVSDLQNKINEYTEKLTQLSKAKDTLINQINILDSQVNLTLLKINQTENSIKVLEEEISNLSIKINDLDRFLNQLTIAFINQINQNYRLAKRIPPISLLFSGNFNSFLEQHKYITLVQKNSQETILNMETVRTNYDLQKSEKEKKQLELEVLQTKLDEQKNTLANQKSSKANLLTVTKNDESRYQQLKKDAENELNSLLKAKFVGKREVKKGEPLGLMGNTGYSFGDHLHFGLYNLKEDDLDSWSYYNDLDATEYINNHRWPMNEPIRITQGRGVTPYAYLYADRFHHGIDMVSTNKTIFAVNDGVAYFFRNPGSSLGNHVKLFHSDGKMTLYLHMQ